MKSRWTVAHLPLSSRGWSHVPRHVHAAAAPELRVYFSWRPGCPPPGLSAARYPQHVAVRVGHPAQDKQQVGQPIQILGRHWTDVRRVHFDRGPRRTLGAACRRAGDMQQRRKWRTTRKYKGIERVQPCVELVTPRLETIDV